jgi:hypothetical protein
MNRELYISVDVETDGPIPGPYSMISLGAAAFLLEWEEPSSLFQVNLEPLPEASRDPDTMKWWGTQKAAWEACQKDLRKPCDAMKEFVRWVEDLATANGAKPVFVGYPAGFDFLFVYWYLVRFTGGSPFSFSAVDIKTYAMAMLKNGYRDSSKKNMPKKWFGRHPHTHCALDDAIGQGYLFLNMLRENLSGNQH